MRRSQVSSSRSLSALCRGALSWVSSSSRLATLRAGICNKAGRQAAGPHPRVGRAALGAGQGGSSTGTALPGQYKLNTSTPDWWISGGAPMGAAPRYAGKQTPGGRLAPAASWQPAGAPPEPARRTTAPPPAAAAWAWRGRGAAARHPRSTAPAPTPPRWPWGWRTQGQQPPSATAAAVQAGASARCRQRQAPAPPAGAAAGACHTASPPAARRPAAADAILAAALPPPPAAAPSRCLAWRGPGRRSAAWRAAPCPPPPQAPAAGPAPSDGALRWPAARGTGDVGHDGCSPAGIQGGGPAGGR